MIRDSLGLEPTCSDRIGTPGPGAGDPDPAVPQGREQLTVGLTDQGREGQRNGREPSVVKQSPRHLLGNHHLAEETSFRSALRDRESNVHDPQRDQLVPHTGFLTPGDGVFECHLMAAHIRTQRLPKELVLVGWREVHD
jgi:hypothetical protein